MQFCIYRINLNTDNSLIGTLQVKLSLSTTHYLLPEGKLLYQCVVTGATVVDWSPSRLGTLLGLRPFVCMCATQDIGQCSVSWSAW